MSKQVQSGYWAVLPAEVRLSAKITAEAKVVYAEIMALSNQKGYAWASNSYFAKTFGASTRSASRWVAELVEAGFVEAVHIPGNSDRFSQRHLRPLVGIGNRRLLNDEPVPVLPDRAETDEATDSADDVDEVPNLSDSLDTIGDTPIDSRVQHKKDNLIRRKKTTGGDSPAGRCLSTGSTPPRESPTRELTDLWCEAYLNHFGRPYKFSGAKDGVAVKQLLAATKGDISRVINVATMAWSKSGKDYWWCGRCISLAMLNSGWNNVLAELDGVKRSGDTPRTDWNRAAESAKGNDGLHLLG